MLKCYYKVNYMKEEKSFNADKFTYHEGEIQFADCQCEFCIYYNNGLRSENCPIELLDKIINDEIKCPNIKDPNAFDWDMINK